MKKPKPGLAELQEKANKYAQDYMSVTKVGIPVDLPDAQFGPLMDGIMRAIIQAWAAGYKAGTER